MPGVFPLSPFPVFDDPNQKAVHSNATITTSGSSVFTGYGATEVSLFINVKAAPTGTSPTLQFTIQEVDPGDGTTVIGTTVSSTVITGIGIQRITLESAFGGSIKVSWTLGGTSSPTFTQVYATLVGKPGSVKLVDPVGAPVTPASDTTLQSILTKLPAYSRDHQNEQTTLLGAGATYTGTFTDIKNSPCLVVLWASDVAPASFHIEWSEDGISPGPDPLDVTVPTVKFVGGVYAVLDIENIPVRRYYRIKITNGATPQSLAIAVTSLLQEPLTGFFQGPEDPITALSVALLTQTIIKGKTADGDYENVGLTPDNALTVSDAKAYQTPSGSIFHEGIRDDINLAFASDTGAADIAKLQNSSTGGTVTQDATLGQAVFSTGATAGNTAVFFSDKKAIYEPGHGLVGEQTIEFGSLPTGNAYAEWGYASLNLQNGTGFGVDATGVYTWRRRNGSYTQKTYSTSWNRDKCNGSAPSLFKFGGSPQALNPLKNNLFREHFEWLGADAHAYFIKSPAGTGFLQVNVEEYPNQNNGSTVPTPAMYLHVAVHNDTSGGGNLVVRSGSWRGGVFTSKTVLTGRNPSGVYQDTPEGGRSINNVTTVALGSNATYTGNWESSQGYVSIGLAIATNQASALNGIQFQFSDTPNGAVIRSTVAFTFTTTDVAVGSKYVKTENRGDYMRIVYTNGPIAQGSFFLEARLNPVHTENPSTDLTGIDISLLNSTTTPLGAGGTFTGTAESVTLYQEIDISTAGGPSNASGTLYFEFSPDGVNWDVSVPTVLPNPSNEIPIFLRIVLPYFRVRYVNDGVAQTSFRLTTTLHKAGAARLTRFLNQNLSNVEPVEIVRAVETGARFNGTSVFDNAKLGENTVDTDNRLFPTLLSNGTTANFTVTGSTFNATGHGMSNGDAVHLTSTGTLPAPLTSSTTSTSGVVTETIYWVVNAHTNDFQVSTSPGGTAVTLTDAGTGTHSFQKRGQFLGMFKDVSQIGGLFSFFFSDVKPGVLRLEWSNDGVTQNSDLLSSSALSIETTTAPGFGTLYLALVPSNVMVAQYTRVRIVNGPANMTLGDFINFITKFPYGGSYAAVDSILSLLSTALLVRNVQAGFTPNNDFKNIRSQGAHDGNSTATPLNANGVFRGIWVNWQEDYSGLFVDLTSDVAGTLVLEFSEVATPADGVDTDVTDSRSQGYDPTVTMLMRRHITVQSKWVRIKYINGTAAQSRFVLDTAFTTGPAVVPLQPLAIIPDLTQLSQMGQMVQLAEKYETPGTLGRLTTTRNTANTKDGLNANITKVEDDLLHRPMSQVQTSQAFVGTSAVQIANPALANRRSVAISNDGRTTLVSRVFVGTSSSVATTPGPGAGFCIPVGRAVTIRAKSTVPLWVICENTGGAQQTDTLTATTATGTATNPSNAKLNDSVYANITAAAQTIVLTGYALTGTLDHIQTVKIGVKANKQTGQFEQVTHLATVTGNAGNVGMVSTTTNVTATANAFYLAAISRESTTTVTGVSGLGLTWTQVDTQQSDDAHRTLDVWKGTGTPTTNGIVTASFSATATNSHIAVSSYSNVDLTGPVTNFNGANGNSNSPSVSVASSTAKGLAYGAISEDNTTLSAPGSGFTEQSDEQSGTAPQDGLSTETKALAAGGAQTVNGTLAGAKHWAIIGVTLQPKPAIDPIITVSYKVSGVGGATSGTMTWTSGTDSIQFLDITADRAWLFTDIANVEVDLVGTTIGAAAANIDQAFLQVVESSANTSYVSVLEVAE